MLSADTGKGFSLNLGSFETFSKERSRGKPKRISKPPIRTPPLNIAIR